MKPTLLILVFAISIIGCSSFSMQSKTALAEMKPTKNNNVSGTISFKQYTDRVEVIVRLSGLTPGVHGYHIHEIGDCSDPDAKNAGGHFNPKKSAHGGPGIPHHHLGDLGNVTADKNGMVNAKTSISNLSFTGDESIIGKSVVVHANPDDLTSQPSGNSGARVACGVIVLK